ncbi:LuxR C-terminal-related transcriptional regulator [Ilumatobacter sp.]|uniref:LuxR C-terminal-related transcriptional regulator n=1 Tax=Ilumatobacter sp. TaxID=1967498 RepID=UPI003AF69B92
MLCLDLETQAASDLEAILGAAAAADVGQYDLLVVDHADSANDGTLATLATAAATSGWQLVVASRRDVRHVFADSARIVDESDLWLDDQSIGELVEALAGQLPTDGRAAVVARLGGWPAGAELVGRSLAADHDPRAASRSFRGRAPLIADYFDAEVLGGIDPHDYEFLLDISVLPNLEVECAAAVSETFDRGLDRLDRLARDHVMLCHAGDGRVVWQPLARETLLERLERNDPARARAAREAALRWFDSHGRRDEAVAVALLLSHHQYVLDTACDVGLQLAAEGDGDTVMRWLDQLPASAIADRPEVALVAVASLWLLRAEAASDEIEDWLLFAEKSCDDRPVPASVSMSSRLQAARAAFLDVALAQRARLAAEAFAIEGPRRTLWAALAGAAAAQASYFLDDHAAARDWANECLLICGSLEAVDMGLAIQLLACEAFGVVAMVELGRRDFARAASQAVAAQMLGHQRTDGGLAINLSTIASAVLEIEHGDADSGVAQLRRVRDEALISRLRTLASVELASAELDRQNIEAADRHLADVDTGLGHEAGDRLIHRRATSIVQRLQETRREYGAGESPALTDRERDVLRLLDSDLTRREIGDQLYLAHNTVKTHVQRLFQKLDVTSRPAAIAAARERGWL